MFEKWAWRWPRAAGHRRDVSHTLSCYVSGLIWQSCIVVFWFTEKQTPVDITLKYGHTNEEKEQRVCSTYQQIYRKLELHRFMPIICEQDARHITLVQGPQDWNAICEVRVTGRKLGS
jgi:hypothetical protein